MFKKIIQRQLENKVKKYLARHKPILVLITGSVGKTSTKQAIATVLSEHYRVRAHDGNHNTHFSIPSAIMGVHYPEDPRSIGQWRSVLSAMDIRIRSEKDVDVIVQELGTDAPGDIAQFASYLSPDIAVVTAVSEEHMEFFKTLDAVAEEELSIARVAKLTVVNRDDVDVKYADLADTHTIDTYGLSEKAEYRLDVNPASPLEGRVGQMTAPEWGQLPVNLQLVGDHSLKAAVAAGCVGAKLGLSSREVAVGMSKIKPAPGRMQVLRGQQNSTLIDDTYNASPLAVAAALKTLYDIDAQQRIAVLGSMNELGDTSAKAHEKIGALCDSKKLDWVVTIGDEAGRLLAPAAVKQGCQVRSFMSPYEAGGFVHKVMEPNSVVLFKGSQNGVFAEEALKVVLHSTEDEEKLVRQSEPWLAKKEAQFDHSTPED